MCWKCGVLFGSRHSYDCMSSGIGRVLTSQSARVTQMNFVAAVNLGGGGQKLYVNLMGFRAYFEPMDGLFTWFVVQPGLYDY